jgi:hypothetical protein
MDVSNPEMIAEWKFDSETWNKFVSIEKKNKKQDNLYFGLGILIIGVPALMFLRDASIWVSLAIVVPLAVLIPFLRQKFAYKHLKAHDNPNIKFYRNFMVINGNKIELFSDKRRIKSTSIFEKEGMLFLELTIEWITGKGPTNDEFRVPVPNNDENIANKLLEHYT